MTATQGDSIDLCKRFDWFIIPMILRLVEPSLQGNCNTFAAAYANELTAAGLIDQLMKWWDELYRLCPKFSY